MDNSRLAGGVRCVAWRRRERDSREEERGGNGGGGGERDGGWRRKGCGERGERGEERGGMRGMQGKWRREVEDTQLSKGGGVNLLEGGAGDDREGRVR